MNEWMRCVRGWTAASSDNSTSNARRKYLVHFDQVELTGEGDPLGFDEEVSRDCIFGPHFTVSATRSVGASQDPVTLRNDASAASLLQSPSTGGVLTPSRQSSSSPPPTAVQQALRVGMRVEARYGVGEDWYDATIVEVQHKPGGNVSYDETTYSLRYDDGDEEQDVSRLKIRLKGEKQRGKLEVRVNEWMRCVRGWTAATCRVWSGVCWATTVRAMRGGSIWFILIRWS